MLKFKQNGDGSWEGYRVDENDMPLKLPPITEELGGNHHPDLDHMDIDELRQFAFENGVELSTAITNPDTARRRITEAMGGEQR